MTEPLLVSIYSAAAYMKLAAVPQQSAEAAGIQFDVLLAAGVPVSVDTFSDPVSYSTYIPGAKARFLEMAAEPPFGMTPAAYKEKEWGFVLAVIQHVPGIKVDVTPSTSGSSLGKPMANEKYFKKQGYLLNADPKEGSPVVERTDEAPASSTVDNTTPSSATTNSSASASTEPSATTSSATSISSSAPSPQLGTGEAGSAPNGALGTKTNGEDADVIGDYLRDDVAMDDAEAGDAHVGAPDVRPTTPEAQHRGDESEDVAETPKRIRRD